MNRKWPLILCIVALSSACAKSSRPPQTSEAGQEAPVSVMDEPLAPAVASPSPQAIAPVSAGTTDAVSAPVGEVAAAPAPETAGMGKIQALSDAQIVKVTETVNEGEIEQAKLARSKGTNPGVKKFAAHMISEHTKANQEGKALAKKAKLVPEESPTSTDVGSRGTATLDSLKAADKANFDRAYIDAQVEQHEAVLSLIADRLLPSAVDEALKAQLEKARTMVETHLTAAKELQSSLPAAASAQ